MRASACSSSLIEKPARAIASRIWSTRRAWPMGWKLSVAAGVATVKSCSADTLFFAMRSDMIFLFSIWFVGFFNVHKITERKQKSTVNSVFSAFLFA
jgi:hypothetical protein